MKKNKKKYFDPKIKLKLEKIGDIPCDKFLPIIGKLPKGIKIKKVSILLGSDGALNIEPFKKGYGIEGFMAMGKRSRCKCKF
jgi:hypothetical protein